MFIIAQIIGLIVIHNYNTPTTYTVFNKTTNTYEEVNANPELPFGMQPPEIKPAVSLPMIVTSFIIAILLVFLLMTIKAKKFLRIWFFVVVIIAITIALNSFLLKTDLYSFFLIKHQIFNLRSSIFLSLIVALPLAFFKIFKRNFLIHNISELLIYPGIAVVFVPLLNISITVILLLLISAYDIWAVWHSGFMQKMAKFQINELKIFSGFFIPYLEKKARLKLKEAKSKKDKLKLKKIKVNLAILGGGDVVFPIIMAGVVLKSLGLLPSLLIVLGSVISLIFLFFFSKKGKFYPAMPFLTSGILFGLAIAGFVA